MKVQGLIRFCTWCAGLILLSCATPGAPTGGPLDKTPPKVIRFEPEKLTKNFDAKTISIFFDEWVDIQDVQRQVIISPPIDPMPEITARKEEINVRLKAPLNDNITYSIFFGDAIKDLREGNKAENILYVFSTGPNIDSLEINGSVKALEGEKIPENTFVLLYDIEDDSVVVKQKPLYAFKLKEGSGNFQIGYLAPKSYKLVTLSDDNRNFLYDLPTEWIGVFPGMIALDSIVRGLELAIQLPEPEKYKIKEFNAGLQNGVLNLVLNKPYQPKMGRFSVELLVPGIVTEKYSYNSSDRLSYYIASDSNSMSCVLKYEDTIIDTIKIRRDAKGAQMGVINTIPQAGAKNGNLSPFENRPLQFKSSIPILEINDALVSFTDSTGEELNFEIKQNDSTWSFDLLAGWKAGDSYTLKFSDSSLKFVNGLFAPAMEYAVFPVVAPSAAGLKAKVVLPSADTMYVISVRTGAGNTIHEHLSNGALEYLYVNTDLPAGDYVVEVIEDLNKSGTWNGGSYWARRSPERVYRSEKVTLKENWEQELEFKVDFSKPVLPLPVPVEKEAPPATSKPATPGTGREGGRPMFDR